MSRGVFRITSIYIKARAFPEKDFDNLNKAVTSPAIAAKTRLAPVIFIVVIRPLDNGPAVK